MKKAWAVLSLVLWTASNVRSADQPINSPLTWTDAVAIALRQNPSLSASSSAREASRASYKQTWNGLMPQVGLSNAYTQSGSNSSPDSSGWSARAEASLDLLNLSSVSKIRGAKAQIDLSEANLWQTSAQLRLSLRRAFSQLLYAQNSVEVSQSIQKMRQKSSQLVTLRYNSGRESKGNMLRARAQLLQADADLSQSLRFLRASQKSLCAQLGLETFRVLSVTGTFNGANIPDLPDDAKPLTLNRPDVAVQSAVLKNSEVSLSSAKSSLWPKLSANYSRSLSDNKEFPSANSGWSFSGVLSYPLFVGGPTDTFFAVSAAQNNLEKARQTLRAIQNDAISEIESTWSSFAGSVDQFKVQSALLEAARQRNEEADVRYNSGLLTYDNWEIIASDRVNQERRAIQSQLDLSVSEALWENAIGKKLGE